MTPMSAVATTVVTTSTPTPTPTGSPPWPAISTIGAVSATRAAGFVGGRIAIEVGLALLFLEVATTFNGHRRRRGRSSFPAAARRHLGALFLENSLAREPDAIAFDREHLHQYLIALFQFIANILDAVLGDLADVQQAIRSRNNFNKSSEVGQP